MDTLGNIFVDTSVYWGTSLLRVLLSFFAGFILGFERKIHQQPAGLRTHTLISLGSTLIMLLSIYMSQHFGSDPSRIAAQVVSGIGFLGGGAILRQGLNIKGLTTAATLWCAAGIGLAIGAGMIVSAFIVLIIIVVMLFVMERVEGKYFPADRSKMLNLVFNNDRIDYDFLQAEIERHGLFVVNMDVSKKIDTKKIRVSILVKTPHHVDIQDLTVSMKTVGKLENFEFTD